MKKLIISLIISILSVSAVYAETYEKDNITIVYESIIDLNMTLDSIEWVDKWFADFGYHGNPEINIVFKNVVSFNNNRVYGLCSEFVIELTTWDDPWLRTRKTFKLSVTKELHHSIIVHELTHLYLTHFAKKPVLNGSQEYFAYTVQLTWLSENIRNTILNLYPEEFDSDSNINGMSHVDNPHSYGVMSYKWSQKHNGSYLKKIIENKFDNDQVMKTIMEVW